MYSKKIILRFPSKLVERPIVYSLVKDFNLSFNILKAFVKPNEEGELVLELNGDDEKCSDAIKYLKGLGVSVEPLSKDVTRIEEKCTHCGACITVCPTGALYMENPSMQVFFDDQKCIACGLCVNGCPFHAMIIDI